MLDSVCEVGHFAPSDKADRSYMAVHIGVIGRDCVPGVKRPRNDYEDEQKGAHNDKRWSPPELPFG